MCNKKYFENLSKEISYALRHAPWEYELELDEEGWVLLEQLISSLKQQDDWKNLTQHNIEQMIDLSDKKRHEISGKYIRAFYGHSLPMKINKKIGIPPTILYHGTSADNLSSILENGLSPMSRQYVHLSEDMGTALAVGKRKGHSPILLSIDTQSAIKDGIKFYIGNEKVWLADMIPSKFIFFQ
ncbi:putative RNA 2'-phosphotransferase [Cricetibacter osteomyelitidis]|uniref:Probable RNA 2'-phosphotransferase n=1 Tax=Cricetibacter osteomyelitidis TaxID=1521931 RepID=A0A4R2SPI4_9PAST|nr:RNA 2'-phosphotransferase [Cricetibacter osteomyelitidis]TCP92057.1 putative RNA 2'-phosphotransferase [Cricetibacter osteomyelitidis]